MSLFDELKRRNVFRVGFAYAVASWLLLQIADVILNNIEAPGWVFQAILLALGLGLPLALIFAWAFEMTPEGIKREKEVDRSQSITQTTGRKLDRIIIVVLVIALAYFAYDELVIENRQESSEQVAGTLGSDAAVSDAGQASMNSTSIAVLPFVDMSPEGDQEYFSDGISEEILNALAGVKELKVAGRTSSFSFKGKNEDLRAIGDTLGVEHILEGSVRKAGNTLRITAQLIKVDDGFHMWSATYDRELNDVFAIQDEISAAILDQLKMTLISHSDEPVIATPRGNVESYSLYLAAKQNIYQREAATIANAITQLDEALRIDPDFAPALAQRAIAGLLASDVIDDMMPGEAHLAEMKSLIDRALSLDANLAEGYEALGLYHFDLGEYQRSIDVLNRALEINPSSLDARNWMKNSLMAQDKYVEAAEITRQLIELDPLYRPGVFSMYRFYAVTGDWQNMKELLDRTRIYLPDEEMTRVFEIINAAGLGQYADAIRLALNYIEVHNDGEFRGPYMLVYANVLPQVGDWQTMVEKGFAFHKSEGLRRLGQYEEALHLIENNIRRSDRASVMIQLLTEQQKYRELTDWMEREWPDLDEFEDEYFLTNAYGPRDLVDLAWAYQQLGNSEKYGEMISRADAVNDRLLSIGAGHPEFLHRRAYLELVRGDVELALDFLEQADAKNWTTPYRLSTVKPAYVALDGNPRYEALLAKWIAHVNAERTKLNMSPIELESQL
jgi:TolB-like protein